MIISSAHGHSLYQTSILDSRQYLRLCVLVVVVRAVVHLCRVVCACRAVGRCRVPLGRHSAVGEGVRVCASVRARCALAAAARSPLTA